MTRPAHRDTRARFTAQRGRCKWCGKPCASDRLAHPDCGAAGKSAREYRDEALQRSADRNGGVPVCAYARLLPTRCSGRLEAHHVQELADNGDPHYVVIACNAHHQEQTNAAAAARRGTPMATPTKTGKGKKAPAGAQRSTGEVLRDLAVTVVLIAAGAGAMLRVHAMPTFDLYSLTDWRLVGGAAFASAAAAGIVCIVLALLVAGARWLHERRARTLDRYRDVLARATHTPPQAMRVRLGWTPGHGRCWYASTFDDADGSRAREAVQDALELKAGRPLHLDWRPAKDTVSWRPLRDDDERQTAPTPQPAQPSIDYDAITDRLERSMRAVLGDKTATVEVLHVAGDTNRPTPTAFDVHYDPGAAVHRETVQDELALKVDSLYPVVSPERWRLTNDTGTDTLHAVRERDPLADVIAQPDPTGVDLRAVPIGVNEAAQPVTVQLAGVHLLIAGQSGAGKGSLVWALMHSLGPAISAGAVQVHAFDPKENEFPPGKALFRTFYVGQDVADVQRFLDRIEAIMAARKAELSAAGLRLHVASPDSPHHLVMIDEWAAVTTWVGNRSDREKIFGRLALIFTQGRALGISIVGATQNPLKDVLAHRDYFTARLCLSVSSKIHVDMILGDGLRARGARADTISLNLPGIGYLAWDGASREPARFRAYFHNDNQVRAIAARYAAPKATTTQLELPHEPGVPATKPTTARTDSTPDRPAGYAFTLPGNRWLTRYADQLTDGDVVRRGSATARVDECTTFATGEDGEEEVELRVTLQRGGVSDVWAVPADEEVKVRA